MKCYHFIIFKIFVLNLNKKSLKMEFIFFLIAMLLGGVASWQVFNWYYSKKLKKKENSSKQEVSILLERIEKVFKVVLAEGHFTEIYDHHSKKDFYGIFNVNKKALIVSKAKVSVGFDFSKLRVSKDENNKKLIIESFPEPEVLSIDTDYKFYDIDQGWLNKFSSDDYTQILNEAKKTMQEKALNSDLPKTANKQIGLMMTQLAASMNWDVEFKQLASEPKKIAEFSKFEEL